MIIWCFSHLSQLNKVNIFHSYSFVFCFFVKCSVWTSSVFLFRNKKNELCTKKDIKSEDIDFIWSIWTAHIFAVESGFCHPSFKWEIDCNYVAFSYSCNHSKCFYTRSHTRPFILTFICWWHGAPTQGASCSSGGANYSHTLTHHWCSHRDQFGIHYLAQVHLTMWTGVSRNQLPIFWIVCSTSWATAAPELIYPSCHEDV